MSKLKMALDKKQTIEIRNLSKTFKLYSNFSSRIKDLLNPSPEHYCALSALSDINFSVNAGECFGIIGANGSGKSTLLKIISGTLVPTSGFVELSGRVLALLELGTGMDPALTGRQNVMLSANLLGFPAEYARKKIDEIEIFADIGVFFDRPIRIYSSGMALRVAFATYLFLQPDILIIDEALSVGDVFFQQKCFAALQNIIDTGTTVLLVSHDTVAIQKFCSRALVLDGGKVRFIGQPSEAVNFYYSLNNRRNTPTDPDPGFDASRQLPVINTNANDVISNNQLKPPYLCCPDDRLSLIAARLVDENGNSLSTALVGQTVRIETVCRAQELSATIDISLSLHDRFGHTIYRTSAVRNGAHVAQLASSNTVVTIFSITLDIATGEYTYRLGITSRMNQNFDDYAQTEMLGPIHVFWDRPPSPFYGIIGLPCRILKSEPAAINLKYEVNKYVK